MGTGEFMIVVIGIGVIVGVPIILGLLYAEDRLATRKHSNPLPKVLRRDSKDVPVVFLLLLLVFSCLACGIIQSTILAAGSLWQLLGIG